MRHTVVERSSRQRSAVSNGRVVLAGLRGTSSEARRLRDLIDALTRELGPNISTVEELQIRTAASAVVHHERLQAAELRGEPVSSEDVTRASNNAARVLAALKRGRKAKPVVGVREAALAKYRAPA